MTTEYFYNKLAFFYPVLDVFLLPRKKRMSRMINNLPVGELLEIGVGTGSQLAQYENHKVTGVDISEKMLEHASKRNFRTNVELKVMNGESLLYNDNSFDYVVISHVLSVTEDPDKMILEAYRVLKKNGLLVILNHETPKNVLKYFDQAFNKLGKRLKLKTEFRINSIQTLNNFQLVKEDRPGILNYFTIAVYKKPREKEPEPSI